MTIDEAVRLVITHRPTTLEKLLTGCGVTLKYLGGGAFRQVYALVGLPLVIKLPYRDYSGGPAANNILHSLVEYRTITKILEAKGRKYCNIKQHMPKLYYHDPESGVILSHKYKKLGLSERDMVRRRTLATKVCKALGMEHTTADLCNSDNVGIDKEGIIKIMDGGCMDKNW